MRLYKQKQQYGHFKLQKRTINAEDDEYVTTQRKPEKGNESFFFF